MERKEDNCPFCGAVMEYVYRSSDATELLESVGYDIVCIINGSCRFVEQGVEHELFENSAYIFGSGSRQVTNRVDEAGQFREIIIHIDKDELFGRMRHSSRAQERFEAAILRGISSNLSIEELAGMCCLSASTFKRRFRERYSSSPHKWFLGCRLDIAAMILRHADIPTRNIASLCGFINVSHFIATFKRRFGTTPSHVSRREEQ
ncbi:MAG: helix-turn-helix transcriptional regulator [Alistipes sp.]|nr:helix-turn-helix transcriptional regulator [Alistipes sp.]